jgi:hypothetical protein
MSKYDSSYIDYTFKFTQTLEETLSFVDNKIKAKKDVDFLIIIQLFIQEITYKLKNHLDPSK